MAAAAAANEPAKLFGAPAAAAVAVGAAVGGAAGGAAGGVAAKPGLFNAPALDAGAGIKGIGKRPLPKVEKQNDRLIQLSHQAAAQSSAIANASTPLSMASLLAANRAIQATSNRDASAGYAMHLFLPFHT